jgi:glycerate kinase
MSNSALRVLIVPDKFKGTLDAAGVAAAIGRGWGAARPQDTVELLPMSDGGDGFGGILGHWQQAQSLTTPTLDAAHRPCPAAWWLNRQDGTAIIESAKVIGLAMLPPGRYHPFDLDSRGLGAVLMDASRQGARHALIGIGGSATNDAGFGLALTLGWQFLDALQRPLSQWTDLPRLAHARPPTNPVPLPRLTVAVDVQNPLLGPHGCSRIYGPQKGLRPEDMATAEAALTQLAEILHQQTGQRLELVPGAGAAGGLGFGLMAFAGATLESGFAVFARTTGLADKVRAASLVITGEGALDPSSIMGKGVGEVARLCQALGVPCLGLAGQVVEAPGLAELFARTRGLTQLTDPATAIADPVRWLEQAARELGTSLNAKSGI